MKVTFFNGSTSTSVTTAPQVIAGSVDPALVETLVIDATAPLAGAVDALTARVAALEGGVTPPAPVAPTFTTQPSLIGSTALGSTITVSLGAASGTPAPALTGTLTRPGKAPAAVGDGATFTVEAEDQGGTITLDGTATNSAGSATASATLDVPAASAWMVMTPNMHVYADVEGTQPAQPGDPVARWDAVWQGRRVAYTQPVLGVRPALMEDEGKRYLHFGMYASLRCEDAEVIAAFAGNTGFFASAAIRTEGGPVNLTTTPDAMIFKITQGTTASSGSIVARMGLFARPAEGQLGFRVRRADNTTVIRRTGVAAVDTDHVVTATYDWTQPSSYAAMIDGVSYDTAPLDAASLPGFGTTAPLHIVIGTALPYPSLGGEWTGRIYGLTVAPVPATAAEAQAVAADHMARLPNSAPALPMIFEGFDGAYTGLGYTAGGEGHFGIRVDREAGNDNTVRHFAVGTRGNLGRPLTLSVLRQGYPPPGMVDVADRWRGSWAYDLKGPWNRFDAYTQTADEHINTRTAPSEQDTVYLAMRPVFTNARWADAIQRWIASPLVRRTATGDTNFRVGTLPAGTTAGGRSFPAFDVHGFMFGTGAINVTLTGNVHPDEHAAAYIYEGAIDWLLSTDPDAVALRAGMTFHCYPGLNPQGRYLGWSRSEPTGQDANRIWTTDYDAVPLSKTMRDIWAADVAAVDFSIDFHDWSDRNTGGGVWRRTTEPGAVSYTSALSSAYNTRTGRSLDISNLEVAPHISDYWRSRGAAWAVTIEHGILLQDTWTDWQAYGVDVARAMLAVLP